MIIYVVSTTSVTKRVYLNMPRLAFLKISLYQVQFFLFVLESLIKFFLCCTKKVFNVWFMISRTPSQF